MVYAQHPKTLITLKPELFSPILESSVSHAQKFCRIRHNTI
jgi:hypothetical protein